MPNTTTLNETTRSPIDGTEFVRLATPGANWKAKLSSFVRLQLTADANYYVDNTLGSDSNPGTLAQPFFTLQHAWDFLSGSLDLAQFNLTINCAASATNYTLTIQSSFIGGKNANILGAASGTTTLSDFFSAVANLNPVLNISRFTMTGVPGSYAYLNVSIGDCFLSAINQTSDNDLVIHGQVIGPNNTLAAIRQDQVGSILNVGGNLTFTGTFVDVLVCSDGAQIFGNGVTFTLSGTPTWTGSFLSVFNDGIWIDGASVYSGAGTGKRFSVTTNAVIDAADSTGTLYPGNSAGTIASGGEYTGITDFFGNVASLPAAIQGAKAYVNNAAAAPVFSATPTGGGTLTVPVYADGTNWRYG